MPDKFEQYYKYLKANGADVAPDFNSFKNTLSDSNKASKYYSYLKENQFDVPDTYDSFANTFGLKKKAENLQSSGIPSRLPNEPNFLQQGQKMASGEIFKDISASVPKSVAQPVVKTTLKDAAIKDKNNNNSYLGAMWNNVVASAERLAGGAARLAQKFDTSPVSMIQESVDKAASSVTGINYEAQREKEIADKVKSFIGKARTSSSSREYEQGLAEGFDITNGIGLDDLKGLGAVLPSMLADIAIAAPTAGSSFAIQGYDDALSTLDNIPEAKYMSETTRTAFGFGGAIVSGVLEKLGMDNILKSGTVTKYVTSKILKETAGELAKKGVKVTAEQFEKAVANKATQMLTKTALKNTVKAGGKAALVEGATEATQEGAMDLMKLAANQLEGTEIFDENDIKNTAASRYLNAAAMGGIFGGTVGTVGSISSRTKNVQQHIEDEVKNAKTQEDIDNLVNEINQSVQEGVISENDAEIFKSMVDENISKPSILDINNEKEVKLSDIDSQIASLNKEDRLYNDNLNKLNKERNETISYYDNLSKESQKDEETSFDDGNITPAEEIVTEKVKPTEEEVYSKTDKKGRTSTYFSNTTESNGLTKTNFTFSRTDQNPNERFIATQGVPVKEALGDKYTVNEEDIPEGAKVVKVSEVRVDKDGNAAATVNFDVDGETFQGEVRLNENKPTKAKEEVKPTELKEQVKPTTQEIQQINKVHKNLFNQYSKKQAELIKAGLRGSDLKNNPELVDIKNQMTKIEDYFKDNKLPQPSEKVEPIEVKEEVKIEEPVSTQKVKIPGTKQSKPIPLSDFTLVKEGERSFTKRVKKDEGGVSGVEPLNQFKLNQGMDSYGNPYPRVHVILDDADAEKYQAFFSAGGKKVAKNPEFRDEINKIAKENRSKTDEVVLDFRKSEIDALTKKAAVKPTEAKTEVKPTEVKKEVKTTKVKSEKEVPAAIPEEVFNPIVNKIKKGIEKLSTTAKVSVLKGNNFAKALDEAIKNGKVNLQSWGGFEKKGFEESPQWQKLIEDGTVKLNFDLKGLEGKPVVVINPDNMLTGAVLTKNGKPIIDGNGGINFVTKFGDVWASSDNATANTLARYINEARAKDIAAGGDGTVHVVVTKGDLSKSLTSHTGAKAAMKVLEYLVDKKYVSLSDFRKALTDVGRKYNIDLDGRLDAKSIHDDIAKKFFGVNDSTFSKRGFFVQDVIDHLAKNSQSAKENIGKIRTMLNTEALPQSTERKTGEISFAKEGIIDAIGHLLSDNMTVGVKNSEAYATIEIKHPVEVVNLNKEEGGHESYPFHLRQIDANGNKVKPILNVLGKAQHVTDVLNDANNQKVDKKGGAGKFGSNQIGMAKGFVKPSAEHPSGVNMMTDATGRIYGFEQNGKIVLNADLMNGNTPFHEAGHLWLNWAKENRSDLHDAGIRKIENSKYLQDVKNNKVYQENAAKLPKGEREAYFKEEALAKAIGDNGERFVNEAQKSDFRKWVKNLWETIATHFGLRGMTADEVSNLTLDEFSKKVVADIVSEQKGEKEAQKEKTTEEVYKDLTRIEKRQIINSKFDELIKELKIEKICPT